MLEEKSALGTDYDSIYILYFIVSNDTFLTQSLIIIYK